MSMRAAVRRTVFALLGLFLAAQVVRPARTNPPSAASASLLVQAPPAAREVLERSCRDCHSNETRWPWYSNVAPMSWLVVHDVNDARSNFNFSEWTSYDSDEQDRLLGAVCALARRGRMPLPSYLLLHHDARLSPPDVAALCSWSAKMRDTLQ